MDSVTINIIWTVAVFVLFIAIVVWAYSKKSKKGFDEAANLVFDDENKPSKREAQQEKRESSSNE
ncbi:hypothetical protein HMF8227_01477 [Saliniradius amylolyticus]|uniref:Uncharacterized protein n=1 Tax=Saliniradius amylolyticus TaxID=2183582 RepID=A0A2S2E355_9ALTE|nr:cbb3-type cytochrome c oxidase subunit 3 [Saliniradius amylolyticus]AWL11952.1 hypothetical protein HMF8227_01477 [Saliniradius amylolyticus]